jgi:murein DD-endopeptidase MepM/ murein hydrolase activator NlpD
MRVSVLNFRSDILLRGAALGLIAGVASGCSSDFSRFAPTGSDYTGSINQQQIINKQTPPVTQPFPQEVPVSSTGDENSSLYNEPLYSGSVQADGSIRPVASTIQRKALAPVTAARSATTSTLDKFPAPSSPARQAVSQQPFPSDIAAVDMEQPVAKVKTKAIKVIKPLDETITGTVNTAAPVIAAAKEPAMVTAKAKDVLVAKAKSAVPMGEAGALIVRSGETLSGLSARYGVPASAIMAANGMSSPNDLKIGQKLVIPGIAAPKASRPVKTASADIGQEEAPLPTKAPVNENVAVLPSVPEVRTKQTAPTTTASNVDKPGFKVIAKKGDPVAKAAKTEAAPEKVAAKTSSGSYAVASGDSLYSIAKRNGTTVDAIKAANGLADGKLKIGQELTIPVAGASVATAKTKAPIIAKATIDAPDTQAKAPDKIETAAIKPAAPSNAVIEEAEKDTAQAPGATGISKLRWPVRGRTLVGYGQADGGKANDGVDISVPNGTPVKSAENGVVIYAGTGLKDFGNTVLVRHDNGLVTVYGHNGEIKVKRGQTVKRGQELAKSGMSGNTKVPKLHFEVRKNSAPVNPTTLLE